MGFNVFLFRYRNKDEAVRRKVRITMALVLWLNEAAWHVWNIAFGMWNIQEHLPLHACSILIWLAGFMLIFKNYRIYEFVYFMGIAGALQGPDDARHWYLWLSPFSLLPDFHLHGLLVTSAIYMTTVEGFRPTWRSMLRVMVISNIYMVVVFFINKWIGSNYLFVAHKPVGPTLLDALPAWPWYLLFMEGLALVMFLLLYLPFMIKDWRSKLQPVKV